MPSREAEPWKTKNDMIIVIEERAETGKACLYIVALEWQELGNTKNAESVFIWAERSTIEAFRS